jgi:small membrane protein
VWFQVVLVLALVLIGAYLLWSQPGPRHLAVRRVIMLVTLFGGVTVIIWPGLLTQLARLVGVGRGVDLLFYFALVAALLYVVNEYKRSVMLARANTQLARELVLTEARLTDRIADLEAQITRHQG